MTRVASTFESFFQILRGTIKNIIHLLIFPFADPGNKLQRRPLVPYWCLRQCGDHGRISERRSRHLHGQGGLANRCAEQGLGSQGIQHEQGIQYPGCG